MLSDFSKWISWQFQVLVFLFSCSFIESCRMKNLGRYLNWVSVKLENDLWSEIDLKLIRLISKRNVARPTIWLWLSLSIRRKIQILLKCEHLVIVSFLIIFTVSALLIGDISRVRFIFEPHCSRKHKQQSCKTKTTLLCYADPEQQLYALWFKSESRQRGRQPMTVGKWQAPNMVAGRKLVVSFSGEVRSNGRRWSRFWIWVTRNGKPALMTLMGFRGGRSRRTMSTRMRGTMARSRRTSEKGNTPVVVSELR